MDKQFYIISLVHTNKRDEAITLWRDNNKGYTHFKEAAGIYEESQIKDGYHNSETDIPISKEILDNFFVKTKEGDVIPNSILIIKNLYLFYQGTILKRKYNYYENSIGGRIKSYRDKFGYNQEYVANKLQITRTAITNIESGRTQITIKHLKKLCELFNIESNKILGF